MKENKKPELTEEEKLIQYFFQNLYDDLSLLNLCALKGSFVIEDEYNPYYNLINILKKIGNDSTLKFLKSHKKFYECNDNVTTFHEIVFYTPLTFTCNINNLCYAMTCRNCKYYRFVDKDGKKYIFLKLETRKTFSSHHLVNAAKKNVFNSPRKSTLDNCKNLEDENAENKNLEDKNAENAVSGDMFYHAENKNFEYDKHKKLVQYIFTIDIDEYIDIKKKYNYCHPSSKDYDNILSNLSNDIFIPILYIINNINNINNYLESIYGGGKKIKQKVILKNIKN